jgi:hypothetical protein
VALQGAIGNRAVTQLLRGANASTGPPSVVLLQRMFSADDLKGPATGQVIWKKYTPDKDSGALFLNHLAQKCNNANQIDSGLLMGVPGPYAVVYSKLGTFLSTVMTNFAAHSFTGSTAVHKNEQQKYPVDAARPYRYFEFGITGTGQTRIVFDRATLTCHISTHYEAPKVLLIGGAPPNAAIAYLANYIDNTLGYGPL